jgi:ACDE family multidrug resistance protein
METMQPLTMSETRRNAWFAYVGAAVALTGAQMISPALPVMQEDLGLSTTDLGLVMSVYLLPAALFSIPAGFLADRLGRRIVFGTAFIGFGVCGLLIPVVSSWWPVLLTVRFLQGVMFAGLLPLTMTILGDAFSGPALVAAQGKRSVAMSIGDGLLPVVGGLIAGAGWFVPWLGQAVAIPFGLAVLAKAVDPAAVRQREQGKGRTGDLLRLFKRGSILVLEYMGFLRMFLKFSILTFLPLLVVGVRDLSPAFAGAVIGVAAGSGTFVAIFAGRLARIGQPIRWITLGVVGLGAAMIGLATMTSPLLILVCAAGYGASDGLMGVYTNSFVTSATGPEFRASFVAITGAIRNLAKFSAPVVFGAMIVGRSITDAFGVLAVATMASAVLVFLLRPLQGSITADGEAPA